MFQGCMECKQLRSEGVQRTGKVLAKRVLAHETDRSALQVYSELADLIKQKKNILAKKNRPLY